MRLDVAMNHAFLVSVLQAECRLPDVFTGFVHRQWPSPFDDFGQIDAVDKFHRQEVNIARLLSIIRRHDVRVGKLSRRLHFPSKPLDGLRMVDPLRVDQLERDRPVHQPMLSPINVSHTTFADQLDNAVARVMDQFGWQFNGNNGFVSLEKSCLGLPVAVVGSSAVGHASVAGFCSGNLFVRNQDGLAIHIQAR